MSEKKISYYVQHIILYIVSFTTQVGTSIIPSSWIFCLLGGSVRPGLGAEALEYCLSVGKMTECTKGIVGTQNDIENKSYQMLTTNNLMMDWCSLRRYHSRQVCEEE